MPWRSGLPYTTHAMGTGPQNSKHLLQRGWALVMTRPQRIGHEGAVYHVTARGNERRAIFRTDEDRERLVAVTAASAERFETRV